MSTRQRRSVSAARLGCLLRRQNAAAVLCASWVTPQSLSVCHSSERLRRAHPVSCPAAVLRHPAYRAAHPLGGRLEGPFGGDERGGGELGSADSGGDEGPRAHGPDLELRLSIVTQGQYPSLASAREVGVGNPLGRQGSLPLLDRVGGT